MPALRISNLCHRFGVQTVLDGVSLTVEEGEFLALVGPSGCGKSTLLRIVAGLLTASEGELFLGEECINERSPRERDVAVVFQNYALYPHMSVAANLAFPLRVRGLGRREIRARVAETADALGLGELLTRKPRQLSGGQMQRVALGRAMIRSPKLFLFDEPLSNLDAKLRQELREEIVSLHRRLGITSLYVTHDQAEAMTMGSRIAVLQAGRLQQVGQPLEVYRRPENAFVARFIGTPPMNLLRGRASAGGFVLGALELPCAPPQPAAGGDVLLGIRPEDLRPGAGSPGFDVRVERVEALGREAWVRCSLGGEPLLACGATLLSWSAGETRRLSWSPEVLHWFDAASGERL